MTINHNPQVILLTTSVAFPNGMAPTQRVNLIARGLTEAGFNVSILCTQVTEREPFIENNEARGTYFGISFEYTTGTTSRANNFLTRQYIRIKGIITALKRIYQFSNSSIGGFIYHYGPNRDNDLTKLLYYGFANILHIPVIMDLREKPGALKDSLKIKKLSINPLYWGHWGCCYFKATIRLGFGN